MIFIVTQKKCKSGERETRNIDAKGFVEKVLAAHVGIVCVTNHNSFDLTQFNEFVEEANNQFLILPGIEFDVLGLDNKIGHVIVIVSDLDKDKFNQEISYLTSNCTADSFKIKYDKLIEFTKQFKCIVTVHKHKSSELSAETISEIKEKMSPNIFLYEPSNYTSLGILVNTLGGAIIGSDCQDWNEYGKSKFAKIEFDIDSFENIFRFVEKNEQFIGTLYNKFNFSSIDISFKKAEKVQNVRIYEGINIVFGGKGTGKSQGILKKAQEYFKSKGNSITYYEPQDSEKTVMNDLKVKSEERNLSQYGKDDCAKDFKWIFDTKMQENVTQFSDYSNYIKYIDKNKSKNRMKILDLTEQMFSKDTEYLSVAKDLNLAIEAQKKINEISLSEYINDKNAENLKNSMDLLIKSIKEKYKSLWIQKHTIMLYNSFLLTYKDSIEKYTETKTKPSSTGFTTFVKNRSDIATRIKKILKVFEFEKNEQIEYSKLDQKRMLHLATTKMMLNDNSKTEEFESIKITQLKK